jgi:hypothetical protein
MTTKQSLDVPFTPQALTLPDSGRSMAIYITGARGAGKTTLEGEIAVQDYLKQIPQVVIDPLGTTIDAFLFRLIRLLQYLPPSQHSRFWERIKYVNMASTDFVVPFPLIYKQGSERSFLEIAERYLNVIRLSAPGLLTSEVQGFPPLHYIGVHTHILLASLDLPITAAENLLRHPEEWQKNGRFAEALARNPQCAPSVAFFLDEFIPARPADRRRLLNPYFDRIFTFSLDKNLRAMFGSSSTPGLNMEEVEREKQTVLLDFRDERDPEMKRFKLLWTFSYLYEHIKLRGRREKPLALLIDEFSALTQRVTDGVNPLVTLLDEFINQYMRNHNIWLTIAHQSIFQVDEQLGNTLLSLGTYIFGRVAMMEEARILADVLWKKDPFRVKHYRKVWGKYDPPPGRYYYTPPSGQESSYFILDTEPEFFPIDEQLEVYATMLTRLRLYEFMLRPALGEGEVSDSVFPLSIHTLVRDKETGESFFPAHYSAVLTEVRALLAAKSGIPVATLLAEQEARLGSAATQEHRKGNALPAPNPAPDLTDQPINRRERIS